MLLFRNRIENRSLFSPLRNSLKPPEQILNIIHCGNLSVVIPKGMVPHKRRIITHGRHHDSINVAQNYIAYSNLYADSVNQSESWHADNFGEVYFNSVGLKYEPTIKMYHDTIQRYTNVGMLWSVTSFSSPIVSFTANCVDTFPNIQTFNFFPDTLKKSDSLYIHFGEVTNVDEIELTMFDGVLRILFPFNRKVPINKVSVSVTILNVLIICG